MLEKNKVKKCRWMMWKKRFIHGNNKRKKHKIYEVGLMGIVGQVWSIKTWISWQVYGVGFSKYFSIFWWFVHTSLTIDAPKHRFVDPKCDFEVAGTLNNEWPPFFFFFSSSFPIIWKGVSLNGEWSVLEGFCIGHYLLDTMMARGRLNSHWFESLREKKKKKNWPCH